MVSQTRRVEAQVHARAALEKLKRAAQLDPQDFKAALETVQAAVDESVVDAWVADRAARGGPG